MRLSRIRIVCHLSTRVQRRLVVLSLRTSVRRHRRVSSRLQCDWLHNIDLLLTLVSSWGHCVRLVDLWMHYRVGLHIHWCSDSLHSMTCIWARSLIQETILLKSFLLCPYLIFIDRSGLATTSRWAVILGLSDFRNLFVGRMARYHRVLVIIISLPGKQVILVHFLFDISHVTVRLKRFTAFYLSIKVLLVHYDGSIFLINSVLIKHAVEDIHTLCLADIVLPLSLVQRGFLKLIIVQLF